MQVLYSVLNMQNIQGTCFGKYDSYEYESRSNYGRIQNIPGFQICQVSAYVSITQCPEYA